MPPPLSELLDGLERHGASRPRLAGLLHHARRGGWPPEAVARLVAAMGRESAPSFAADFSGLLRGDTGELGARRQCARHERFRAVLDPLGAAALPALVALLDGPAGEVGVLRDEAGGWPRAYGAKVTAVAHVAIWAGADAAAPLLRLLHRTDESPWLRVEAGRALVDPRREGSAGRVLDVCLAPGFCPLGQFRPLARRLASLGAVLVGPAIERLDDVDDRVAYHATVMLEEIGRRTALPLMQRLRTLADPRRRAETEALLQRLAGERVERF